MIIAAHRHRLTTSLIALAIAGTTAAPAFAQDGTDAATPIPPTTCKVVDASASAIPATETPAPEESPEASPVAIPATPQASPVASPVASPAASPVAEHVHDPAVADDPLATDLEASTNAVFGCLNERNFAQYAALTSDVWRGSLFGSSQRLTPEEFEIFAAGLPDIDTRLVSISRIERVDVDTVHAEVTWVAAYQQFSATWVYQLKKVDGITTWIPWSQTPLPVETPEGAYVIDVTIGDNAYTLDPDRADGSEVVLEITNGTKADHEVLVVRLDQNVQPEILLQGGEFPKGVEFIGQVTVLAGQGGSLHLTHLPAGTYTIVDLLPDASGTPNLANGMKTTFEVKH